MYIIYKFMQNIVFVQTMAKRGVFRCLYSLFPYKNNRKLGICVFIYPAFDRQNEI